MRAGAGVVFAGLASFVLMGAGQALYGPSLPALARGLGTGTEAAALVIPAHWLGSAAGVAAMFRAGGRAGPRPALAALAAGAALIAAGAGLGSTLAGAALFGAGYGASTVMWNRRFLAAFGARGPSMLALLNAVFAVGAILAPLGLVALGGAPGAAFAGLAAVAAVVLLAARPSPEPAAPEAAAGRFVPHFDILAFGAAGVGLEASLIGLGPLALIGLGQGEAAAAGSLSAFFLAFLAARLALVPLAGRIAPFGLYALAMAATAMLAAAAAVTGAVWIFVALGASVALLFPGFYMTGARIMGPDPRAGASLVAAGLVGGTALPAALGAGMAMAGDGALFAMVAAVAAAVALAAVAVRRRLERRRPAS